MVSPASYPERENIFINRGHWNEHGIWVPTRNTSAICWCPKEVSLESNLCERCQDLRLRHLILCEPRGKMIDLGKLDVMIKRPECDLCSLFVLGCKQTWRDTAWEDASTGALTQVYLNAPEASRQRPNGYALQISEFHTGKMYQWVEFEIIFRGHGAEIRPVEKSIEVCLKVDFHFLRAELKKCEMTHVCCNEVAPQVTLEKLCVIDLVTLSIGSAPQNCRFVALSYVWGKITQQWLTLTRANFSNLGKKNALVGVPLPQTVRDAMQLCFELQERYLWVDSLCIVQDDRELQSQQINIMDSIYTAAKFTIIAAAGNHADAGLPGIGDWLRSTERQTITILDIEVSNTIPRFRDTAELSVWNNRGWTYQERMFSRRCIFLTEAQAYYACSRGVEYERKDHHPADYWGVENYKPLPRKDRTLMETYVNQVTDYTLRSLTSQADILRAFTGVTNEMSRTFKQPFYFGLPRENFADALLWQQAHYATRRVVPGLALPSWSWAGTHGAIKYSFVEQRITPASTIPVPGFWKDGEEPNLFQTDWLLNVDGSHITSLNLAAGTETMPVPAEITPVCPPASLLRLTLQREGRLLFSAQLTTMFLKNSVPFDYNDNLWTDYTQDIDQSHISIVSILSSRDATEPAGFIELDKIWTTQNLSSEYPQKPWHLIAISLAAMKADDFMNRFFTQRRKTDVPLVLSRNVSQLVVNVMMVRWNGEVATRLGVGKIYLDFWEAANPETKWVILE